MSRRPHPFNRLPIKLVHYILRMAAASSRSSSLIICLVSSWAHRIARSHLFHTIAITGTIDYMPVIPNTNVTSVDGVWIAHRDDIIFCVLGACANVTHLALGSRCINRLFCRSSPGDAGKIISGSQDLHLAVLDNPGTYDVLGSLYRGPDHGRESPIFDQITHMRLTFTLHRPLLLTHLGRLSHVSMPYYFWSQNYIKNLHSFLRLRALTMLVVAMSDKVVRKGYCKKLERWVREVKETDRRVYLVEGGRLGGFREEWEDEVRGGESIGDRAVRYTDAWERASGLKGELS
jgi:hypothetical protein